MIIRLILFILGYLLMFSIPITAIGYAAHKALEPRRKRRHTQKLAEYHAKLLAEHMRENEEQQCFHCLEKCTEEDCYEENKGWYHARCLKNLLGS